MTIRPVRNRRRHESARSQPVEIDRLVKEFGGTAVVDELSLDVREGELVSLLGPSGCGKTTTLRIVAGLETPTRGDVRIGGRSVVGLPPYRRNLGLVPQQYTLFPHLTAFENVAFGLRMRRVTKSETAERVRKALRSVGLGEHEDRLPRQLSGGQQQRVAVARAIAIDPSVLLLDEPLGALDRKLREQMQIELKLLQERVGLTTVFVTHDQEEALTLSDRIAVMNEGRIQQLGTPKEVYEQPNSHFVADFLGISNFVAGNVVACDGHRVVVETAAGRCVADSETGPTAPSTPVEVCFRPETVTLTKEPATGENAHRGVVDNVVYHGMAIQVRIRLDGDVRLVARLTNERNTEGFTVGDDVWARWPAEVTQVYPRPEGAGESGGHRK